MLSASVYRFFFLYYVYTVALWLYKVDIFIIHNLKNMGKKAFCAFDLFSLLISIFDFRIFMNLKKRYGMGVKTDKGL